MNEQVTVYEIIELLNTASENYNPTYKTNPYGTTAERIKQHGIAPPEGYVLVPVEQEQSPRLRKGSNPHQVQLNLYHHQTHRKLCMTHQLLLGINHMVKEDKEMLSAVKEKE